MMPKPAAALGAAVALGLVTLMPVRLAAHSGPPFPIVSDLRAGPYVVSLWTDPDTTDDGSAGGQFWLMLQPADPAAALPGATRATVVMTPLDRDGPLRSGQTEPVDRDPGRQFVGLVMDHEGRFGVRVSVDGPLGPTTFDAEVDGTYDERPAPMMMLLFLAPFVIVGLLWLRLMRRRSGR